MATVTVLPTAQVAGSGSYAELNFKAGTANYIQPLFLSVASGVDRQSPHT